MPSCVCLTYPIPLHLFYRSTMEDEQTYLLAIMHDLLDGSKEQITAELSKQVLETTKLILKQHAAEVREQLIDEMTP